MCITSTRTGITIDQCNYLEKVLTRFQLTDAKAAITPLLSNWEPKANTGKATTAKITVMIYLYFAYLIFFPDLTLSDSYIDCA